MKYFPFYYTGEMVFYKPDAFEVSEFQKQIESDTLSIKTLLNFPASIELELIDDNVSIHILYKIMSEQNIILLFSVLFAVFFNFYDSNTFSILSIIVGIFYYFGNISALSKSIRNLVYTYIGGNLTVEESALWKQQQKWMKDKTLCPACGEPKNPYSNKCVSCGIYFSKNPVILESGSTTAGKNIVIDYNIKKSKS